MTEDPIGDAWDDDAVPCDGCPCCDHGDPDAACPVDQFRDPVPHRCRAGAGERLAMT
jgi:hypothetical protein